jgi:hypothetical protein
LKAEVGRGGKEIRFSHNFGEEVIFDGVLAIASRRFFFQIACFLIGRCIQGSIPCADMRCDTHFSFSLGVAAMTLPEPTAPALAPAYHGLHLVPPSAARSVPEPDGSANLLYRAAAVGAALFLVVTLF